MQDQTTRTLIPLALAVLAGCGGGSGSGGPPASVTLDSTSLTAYVEQYPITVTPDPSAFTFANFAAPPFVELSAPTTGGINSLSFTMADATHGGIMFVLNTPSAVGAGYSR